MIEDATKPNLESSPDVISNPEVIEIELPEEPDVSLEASTETVTLDLKEAAFVLGKSMRALERSLSGKWGNKLPDGWTARKAMVGHGEQWQIVPPSGFNLDGLIEHKRNSHAQARNVDAMPQQTWLTRGSIWTKGASQLALGRPLEVVQLLRELASTHKELAEERRAHLEDLRMLSQVQSSMRLLEVNARETTELKADLMEAQKDLIALKNQYQTLLNMPWWKRLFMRTD